MVDITHKNFSLRKAIAQAIVKVGSLETIEAIKNRQIPKGDVFEVARTAGLFAAKRTAEMIPDCHPLPIEYTNIRFNIEDLSIYVSVEVHTIYKTGVEVEAMHAASVVALTIYDMLKPLDKNISIEQIKLLDKKGGKTDYQKVIKEQQIDAAVIVCSDSIAAGKKEDKAGKVILDKLASYSIEIKDYAVIPDDPEKIKQKALNHSQAGVKLIIFTGGTGLSPRDFTPETLHPLLDRHIPGIEEAIRHYGQLRMPYSMLSRSVSGLIKDSLVLALPGSTSGAKESMDAVFPAVLHIFRVLAAFRHDEN
jgi:cyclic pyranopterin monophosphate synthase